MESQIALDTFIDNCAMLGVEACLLDDLTSLFAQDKCWDMAQEKVADLAAEPAESLEERKRTQAQLVVLEDVIRTCRRHVRQPRGD